MFLRVHWTLSVEFSKFIGVKAGQRYQFFRVHYLEVNCCFITDLGQAKLVLNNGSTPERKMSKLIEHNLVWELKVSTPAQASSDIGVKCLY